MPTFYRLDHEAKWTAIGDDVDLEKFGEQKLREFSHCDSDGDYSHYIEFDRDGVRTYGRAHFNGWYYDDDEMNGIMSEYDYHDEETMKKWHGKYAVKRHPYSPHRDYLLIGSWAHPGNPSYSE